jgi:hypothetical protein
MNEAAPQPKVAMPKLLLPGQRQQYADLKKSAHEKFKAAMEFWAIMDVIRKHKLFREEYATFEDFCQGEFDQSARAIRREITENTILKHFEARAALENGTTWSHFEGQNRPRFAVPATKSVVRALAALPDEHWDAAWDQAVESHPEHNPTVKHVERVVADYRVKHGLAPSKRVEGAGEANAIALSQKSGTVLGTAKEVTTGGVRGGRAEDTDAAPLIDSGTAEAPPGVTTNAEVRAVSAEAVPAASADCGLRIAELPTQNVPQGTFLESSKAQAPSTDEAPTLKIPTADGTPVFQSGGAEEHLQRAIVELRTAQDLIGASSSLAGMEIRMALSAAEAGENYLRSIKNRKKDSSQLAAAMDARKTTMAENELLKRA